MSPSAEALRRRPVVWAATGLALTGLAGAALAGRGATVVSARVHRGDLVATIEVEGELSAVRSVEVGPPLVRDVWEYKITYLAPEGAAVRRGQPLVSFDASSLMQQLQVKTAEFQEASTRIERRRMELQRDRGELGLQLAEAEAALGKARLKSEVPEELRARNEVRTSALDLKGAQQTVASLRARKASLEQAQDLSLRTLVNQRDRAQGRVAELRQAVEAMTVKASQDGSVIYKVGWSGQKKKIGDSTFFGEALLSLPDASSLRAEGQVDEADTGAVRLGQRVTLRLEALASRDVQGSVAAIARAVRRKSPRVPAKVLPVQIALARPDPLLRPSMRFRGEIEVSRVAGLLLVPREAVLSRPTGAAAWVKRATGYRLVAIRPGRQDRRSVEVLDGLREGDEVATAGLEGREQP